MQKYLTQKVPRIKKFIKQELPIINKAKGHDFLEDDPYCFKCQYDKLKLNTINFIKDQITIKLSQFSGKKEQDDDVYKKKLLVLDNDIMLKHVKQIRLNEAVVSTYDGVTIKWHLCLDHLPYSILWPTKEFSGEYRIDQYDERKGIPAKTIQISNLYEEIRENTRQMRKYIYNMENLYTYFVALVHSNYEKDVKETKIQIKYFEQKIEEANKRRDEGAGYYHAMLNAYTIINTEKINPNGELHKAYESIYYISAIAKLYNDLVVLLEQFSQNLLQTTEQKLEKQLDSPKYTIGALKNFAGEGEDVIKKRKQIQDRILLTYYVPPQLEDIDRSEPSSSYNPFALTESGSESESEGSIVPRWGGFVNLTKRRVQPLLEIADESQQLIEDGKSPPRIEDKDKGESKLPKFQGAARRAGWLGGLFRRAQEKGEKVKIEEITSEEEEAKPEPDPFPPGRYDMSVYEEDKLERQRENAKRKMKEKKEEKEGKKKKRKKSNNPFDFIVRTRGERKEQKKEQKKEEEYDSDSDGEEEDDGGRFSFIIDKTKPKPKRKKSESGFGRGDEIPELQKLRKNKHVKSYTTIGSIPFIKIRDFRITSDENAETKVNLINKIITKLNQKLGILETKMIADCPISTINVIQPVFNKVEEYGVGDKERWSTNIVVKQLNTLSTKLERYFKCLHSYLSGGMKGKISGQSKFLIFTLKSRRDANLAYQILIDDIIQPVFTGKYRRDISDKLSSARVLLDEGAKMAAKRDTEDEFIQNNIEIILKQFRKQSDSNMAALQKKRQQDQESLNKEIDEEIKSYQEQIKHQLKNLELLDGQLANQLDYLNQRFYTYNNKGNPIIKKYFQNNELKSYVIDNVKQLLTKPEKTLNELESFYIKLKYLVGGEKHNYKNWFKRGREYIKRKIKENISFQVLSTSYNRGYIFGSALYVIFYDSKYREFMMSKISKLQGQGLQQIEDYFQTTTQIQDITINDQMKRKYTEPLSQDDLDQFDRSREKFDKVFQDQDQSKNKFSIFENIRFFFNYMRYMRRINVMILGQAQLDDNDFEETRTSKENLRIFIYAKLQERGQGRAIAEYFSYFFDLEYFEDNLRLAFAHINIKSFLHSVFQYLDDYYSKNDHLHSNLLGENFEIKYRDTVEFGNSEDIMKQCNKYIREHEKKHDYELPSKYKNMKMEIDRYRLTYDAGKGDSMQQDVKPQMGTIEKFKLEIHFEQDDGFNFLFFDDMLWGTTIDHLTKIIKQYIINKAVEERDKRLMKNYLSKISKIYKSLLVEEFEKYLSINSS